MAGHGQRKPPISVAPGWNVPGATPVAFPSIREIPRGPSSLRRHGQVRHRKPAANCLLSRKAIYLQAGALYENDVGTFSRETGETGLHARHRLLEDLRPAHGKDARAMGFLNSLAPAEREAFMAVAMDESFPRGAQLMIEGEQANYVMVILSGWTRITVRDNGEDRVLAERGPGQLVGERAALRQNVRSATVTALNEVTVLVMKTADFASFISAHPRVLEVVENQIYDRLIENPEGYAQDDWPAAVSRRRTPSAARSPAARADGPELHRAAHRRRRVRRARSHRPRPRDHQARRPGDDAGLARPAMGRVHFPGPRRRAARRRTALNPHRGDNRKRKRGAAEKAAPAQSHV